jgi:fluoroquinolone transport system permease protein
MNTLQAIRALGPIDVKGLWRDPFLRWMTVFSLGAGLLIRWGVPALAVRIQDQYQFDITPYYPMIMSFNLVLMPTMAGMVIGFLLLDQKDDDTLSALQVTPLTLHGYLAYRIASPMLLSTLLTMVVMKVSNLTPIDPFALLGLSLAVAPVAPIFALFLAAFANNKVQGMALTKANALFTMPPVVAWFVHGPWQFAFVLVPTYWPCKAFWQYAEGRSDYGWYLLGGFVFLMLLLIPLTRRFMRVMTR